MTERLKVVVIGNGMVGQRFLEELVARGREKAVDFDITTFCEEPRPAYDRVQLTSYFSGKSAADLSLVTRSFFKDAEMTLRLNDGVLAVDPVRKVVRSARYREVSYDKLVFATGSYPFVPAVPGKDRRDCFGYRTIEDLEVIAAAAQRTKVGVVIGGGLLGLEAAKALKDLGLETHIVEFAQRLMAVQLDDSAGRLLRRKIEALGAKVHLQKHTKEITEGTDRRQKLVFADGTSLETDLIVFAAGIRPRDELARAAGLAVGERGGIQIDSHCRTANPDIYAIGECALWEGRTFGLVAPGYQMAEVAARHLTGEDHVRFLGADMSTKLKLMGVDVASIGDAHGTTPNALNYVFTDEAAGVYKKLVVSPDRKYVLGGILLGDAADYRTLLQMALNPLPLPEHPEDLILPARAGSGKGIGVDLLPGSALICSCNNVSKERICEAVSAGCASLAALKKETKAGTSCGGCAPLAKETLIVLGEVSKRFGLYTKITGAQRIDLLGARVEQLPLIWRELVDAGFESGHAYGKALRTVKSCVGSTWCRYGVQDSVTTAISIENRYRGLRAPHKLKMAVSGCTRECAEAQSKDVGIIATEKGWNLYVCGNGGMKPRHADLLAKDLSD